MAYVHLLDLINSTALLCGVHYI